MKRTAVSLRRPAGRPGRVLVAAAGLFLAVVCGRAAGLAWEAEKFGRSAALTPVAGSAGFTQLPPEATGIRFTNALSPERHLTNQILLNGSGVAAGDMDGDGWCDVYFAGLNGAGRLFRNLGGWKFEDATFRLPARPEVRDTTGAAFTDVDGDGDLDLLLNSIGTGTALFLNDGRGRFSTSSATFNLNRCGQSMALADFDGDGDLDLYIANYRTMTIRDQPNTRFNIRTVDGRPQVVSVDGRPVTDPGLADRFIFRISSQDGRGTFAYDENGELDLLLRNEGGGTFSSVSFTDGTFVDEQGRALSKAPLDWGLTVMARDFTGDGAPDLYVCNDFKSPDRVWVNDGRGRFRAIEPLALRKLSLSSMGVDFADINRDGHVDFLVVDMLSRDHFHRFTQRIDIKPESHLPGAIDNRPQYPRNTLFLNRGDRTWTECAAFYGVEATEWSWTPVFLDVDLDGYEDLLVSNGFERDGMNVDVLRRLETLKKEQVLTSEQQLRLRALFPQLDTGNLAFRNIGGLMFTNVSDAWGFNLRAISQGMCLADLDNDGDQDVILNNMNAPAAVYRNESGAPRVAVRLKGRSPNTRGIGAQIRLLGGPVPQSQEMIAGGRYLSSDDALRTFAAPRDGLRLEVTWRNGLRTVLDGVRSNRLYEIDETSAVEAAAPADARPAPHFIDVTAWLEHTHQDALFDDFALQPSLSRRLSQLGPGVGWFDLDADGWEDVIVGAGRGGQLAVFKNIRGTGFKPWDRPLLPAPASRDQTTILGLHLPGAGAGLLVGLANYEDGQADGDAVSQLLSVPGRPVVTVLPSSLSSAGPLALADVDADGHLDLFVGGRVRHGRYPEPVSSHLLLHRQGRFQVDAESENVLKDAGLVSGAVFSDLDADGDPDLLLACEWGALKIFRNDAGKLKLWNPPVRWAASNSPSRAARLSELTGWWNGVTTGDFDGDGRLDVAASNWGRNTRYEAHRAEPLRVFFGDAANDGSVHVIEAYSERGSGRLLPLQPFHIMGLALPAMRERVATFENYARATLPEIYPGSWDRLGQWQAAWLDSTVFLNRGDHFEVVPLPAEAQLAPAFGICAGDLDGDGREDLFLSQNFFAQAPDYSRLDAGRGLWLRGDGQGRFAPVAPRESGVKIDGEQRGAALADFDGDGRLDLLVGQNAAPTRLYRNAGARPGLRVRLAGPPGNPHGVGAALRLLSGGKDGPVREIHAGSGYWSQDGAVAVLATPGAAEQLRVRWPGGTTATVQIPAGAREISVDASGKVVVLR